MDILPNSEKRVIKFENNEFLSSIYGACNANLKIIEQILDIKIHAKGNELCLYGNCENIEVSNYLFNELSKIVKKIKILMKNLLEKS